MNPGVTSREAIMQVCRRMAAEQGLPALSMRAVAGECGIALGTLYNYYSDKDELLIATVESVWQDIFHLDGVCETAFSFPDYVAYLFDRARAGAAEYPNFLTAHSIAIAKSRQGEAKSTMERYFAHMKAGMLAVLRRDPGVRPAVFSPSFTESDLVDFVLDHILLLLVQDEADCTALTELVRRVIYR
ncbi:MAG: TetR/AcrR family transcriptional regulator [Candidatus Onthomonas sp.]